MVTPQGGIFALGTASHAYLEFGISGGQRPLSAMLESVAGLASGPRDALMRYTRALTGSYHFVPSADALRSAATPPSSGVAAQRIPDQPT